MVVINQPSNLIKLTNVSVVRLKKGGKRFEVACYKNKILEWRSGVETDIDEVLQISNVFTNVSKGKVACMEDLKRVFQTSDMNVILQEILKKGDIQVGEKERSHQIENTYKDIVRTIVDMCVNPTTKKAYTASMIEKALKDLGFSVNLNKNVKSQALDVIKHLKEKNIIPIERARMRVRIVSPLSIIQKLKEKLEQLSINITDEEWNDEFQAIAYIDPGDYKRIIDFIRQESKDKGYIEVLDLKEIIEEQMF
ncbi:SBDS family rRNA metabolism protein [Pneumocystis jirovecii RU7]|uniref:SBDS family rRNA metabolism protein n=1 Tax=Pneumocystis jirovecii (strain RU7) TaxID=1408657 RepID=A0A0W4ZMC9_PNEJ7|nr:SBDS family rRNA metabolism protein [Pneumocystis jirovecii RU7]KTW29534.1 SBDS family rRNA metabolism protein [Pneumocystis jirovecii RU7]